MSICYTPDTLLGENKTNANLFFEVFGSQNTYVPPSLGFYQGNFQRYLLSPRQACKV